MKRYFRPLDLSELKRSHSNPSPGSKSDKNASTSQPKQQQPQKKQQQQQQHVSSQESDTFDEIQTSSKNQCAGGGGGGGTDKQEGSSVSIVLGGDFLKAGEKFLIHQCNCNTIGARGIAKSIFEKWPSSNIYKKRSSGKGNNGKGKGKGSYSYSTPGTIDVAKVSPSQVFVLRCIRDRQLCILIFFNLKKKKKKSKT
jgi:hypothetical protein